MQRAECTWRLSLSGTAPRPGREPGLARTGLARGSVLAPCGSRNQAQYKSEIVLPIVPPESTLLGQ